MPSLLYTGRRSRRGFLSPLLVTPTLDMHQVFTPHQRYNVWAHAATATSYAHQVFMKIVWGGYD